MTGPWIGAGVLALVVLLFAADWFFAGRTKKRLSGGRQQDPAALSRRDAMRAESQNNTTRINLSGPGSGSGG